MNKSYYPTHSGWLLAAVFVLFGVAFYLMHPTVVHGYAPVETCVWPHVCIK